MKKLFLLIAILLPAAPMLSAQPIVPVQGKMVTREDYQRYEQDVVKTIDWLQETPWKQDPQLYSKATSFLFKWIQGTPTITMELMPPLVDLTDQNNKLMASFIGGYTKYAIQHPVYLKEDANMAAVKALFDKYRAEPDHKKDSDIEHLLKLEKEGTLKDWVINEYEKVTQNQ
ncbi:hypothetical protein MUY27_06460 [Mucilaginibacter sp. RS28]|uniref:Uncharacterized protein n=1 Tax=Mucilaginibacter straminoryzae TaxID=2932774 RepID=A0A9X1X645_9SPHI|nr:hypothetical protein [Mucilaginibacter straminoryzae]MCJ8209344.1 hypothetical protein [Mucilaginibacter straminoryzae]